MRNSNMSEDSEIESIIPRKEKHKKMIEHNLIRRSTPDCFVVPCLERSFGFKTNEFVKNVDKLGLYIEQAEFEGFVRQANKIIDHQLYQKAQKETEPYFNIISLLLKLSIGLGIFTFTILSAIVYGDISDDVSNMILIVSIILIIFSVVIAALCPVFLYRSEFIEINHELLIKEKLEKLAEDQNTKLENSDKDYLKWKFQKDFFWIELHMDQTKLRGREDEHAPEYRKQTMRLE